jgi:hypothetical protein
MLMTSPSGKVTIDVHPSQVESMKNSGYKPANEVPPKKAAKKIQKVEDDNDGNV